MTFAGVFYCTMHAGVANEDDHVCDFHESDLDNCVLHPCYYDPKEVRE